MRLCIFWPVALLILFPACSPPPAPTAPPAEPVDIPALIKKLKDPNPSARLAAVERLERLGPQAKEAVPALIEALDDPDPHFRREVMETLEAVDPEAARKAQREKAGGGTTPTPPLK